MCCVLQCEKILFGLVFGYVITLANTFLQNSLQRCFFEVQLVSSFLVKAILHWVEADDVEHTDSLAVANGRAVPYVVRKGEVLPVAISMVNAHDASV